MGPIALSQQLVPFVCTAIVAPAIVVAAVAYVRFRGRQFLAVLFILIIAGCYLGLVSAFVVLGPLREKLDAAVQVNRFLEVVILLFFPAIPFFIRETFVLGKYLTLINTFLIKAGIVLALLFGVSAFVTPELYVSVTEIWEPGTAEQILWGAGRKGFLFRLRDVLFGLQLINGTAVIIYTLIEHDRRRQVSSSLYWGFVAMAVLAALDLIKNFTGTEALLANVPFQRFEVGLAIFGFVCYLNALQSFFSGAQKTLDLQKTLTDEIGERRSAEAELRHYRDSLEKLVEERTRELNESQQALVESERLAVLGRVVATVSHEIRNPLGTIANAFYTIKKEAQDLPSERIQRAIRLAEKNLQRCGVILDELLDFSRRRKPSLETVILEPWITEVAKELQSTLTVDITTELAPGISAQIDVSLFHRALVNLCTNAQQAMADLPDDQKVVRITTWTDGYKTEIGVTDRGPGIPDDVLEKAFEPLFSSKSFGVGLGLAITRSIMRAHGGDVELRNARGGGGEAVLWLPATGHPASLPNT